MVNFSALPEAKHWQNVDVNRWSGLLKEVAVKKRRPDT
jgi:hypothetical protein